MPSDLGSVKLRKNVPCVLIGGGQSTRFSGPKGMATLAGQPLVAHTINSLRRQTSGQIAVNCPVDSPYSSFGDLVLPDRTEGQIGPLAGLHAALCWAAETGEDGIITAPIDTPFLPQNYIEELSENGVPSLAGYAGRLHPICGYWPVHILPKLETEIGNGMRAMMAWQEHIGAQHIRFETATPDPFFNVNTRADLESAAQLLGEV